MKWLCFVPRFENKMLKYGHGETFGHPAIAGKKNLNSFFRKNVASSKNQYFDFWMT
jgi:hypothetical protein